MKCLCSDDLPVFGLSFTTNCGIQEQETLSFIRENLEKSDQLTKGMVWRDTHNCITVLKPLHTNTYTHQNWPTVINTRKHCFIIWFLDILFFLCHRSPFCHHLKAVSCSWRIPSYRSTSRRRTCNGCRRMWIRRCPAWTMSSATTMLLKTPTGSYERGESFSDYDIL